MKEIAPGLATLTFAAWLHSMSPNWLSITALVVSGIALASGIAVNIITKRVNA